MADDTALIRDMFTEQKKLAQDLVDSAQTDIQKAFDALSDSGIYKYDPYRWNMPSPAIIGSVGPSSTPSRPGRPADPREPELQKYDIKVPNPDFGTAPINSLTAPSLTFPTAPATEPTDITGNVPAIYSPSFPGTPALLGLPSTALPYPFVTIPNAPVITMPVLDAVPPGDISVITLDEYLQKLTDSYTRYSQQIPAMIRDNAMVWFDAVLAKNPNVRLLDGMVTSYVTQGGAGIPVPIEEAIVTRATDRVSAEYKRKNAEVWEDATRRGLTLPSGVLMAGRKAARAEMAEGVSKVATDVAIKNLEFEQEWMKFMFSFGRELQQLLATIANDSAKVMLECNAQAIDITKTILTGMIEVNNAIVRMYLAKWEGYKAAVEAFRARISAIEAQVRVYEAQIRAELAKTEVNRAVVEILQAIVNGNRALVEMYKTQVDAETAKVESSRVAVLGYEAQVRGYTAKVDAYKVRWDGYRAGVDGQLALTKVYESQQLGYKTQVEGYTAGVEAYRAQVNGYTAQIEAVAKQNEAALRAWSIEWDGILKSYTADIDAYGRNWSAIGEEMRANATVLGIQAEFLGKVYTTETQIEIERAREHFSLWQAQLRAALDSARGITGASEVASGLANSALNSLTAFAGSLVTSNS